jgi:hypothetical protein
MSDIVQTTKTAANKHETGIPVFFLNMIGKLTSVSTYIHYFNF